MNINGSAMLEEVFRPQVVIKAVGMLCALLWLGVISYLHRDFLPVCQGLTLGVVSGLGAPRGGSAT